MAFLTEWLLLQFSIYWIEIFIGASMGGTIAYCINMVLVDNKQEEHQQRQELVQQLFSTDTDIAELNAILDKLESYK